MVRPRTLVLNEVDRELPWRVSNPPGWVPALLTRADEVIERMAECPLLALDSGHQFVFRKKLGSPRQPQERTTDCDKQKNSQDTTTEEQVHAFVCSKYLSHANYNGPKRR
jgi:hypothetical protein